MRPSRQCLSPVTVMRSVTSSAKEVMFSSALLLVVYLLAGLRNATRPILPIFCGSPVIWATNRLGDRQVGDKPTGRQPTRRHILVDWATDVETTGPQKCEGLTIPVIEQICATMGQRPFNSTHQTNLPPFCLNAAKLRV